MAQRQDHKHRRNTILEAALRCSIEHGYTHVTREMIATRAECSPALISAHMGTMPNLRRAIMREAIRVECLPVVAQGLALRDRHAQAAPPHLKDKALATLRKE